MQLSSVLSDMSAAECCASNSEEEGDGGNILITPQCITKLRESIFCNFHTHDSMPNGSPICKDMTCDHTPELDRFFESFMDVGRFLKNQQVFRDSLPLCEQIIQFLIHVGQGLKSEEHDGEEETLGRIMRLLRIFSRLDELSTTIGVNGGVKFITAAMIRYPESVEIQTNSSATFANMASVETNRTLMIENNCLSLVVENIRKFSHTPKLLIEICATLANLSSYEKTCRILLQSEVITHVLQVMNSHVNQADLQIQCFSALSGIARFARENIPRELFTRAVEVNLEANAGNVDVLTALCNAVGSVSCSVAIMEESKDKIIDMALRAMKRFPDNLVFQITSCFSLAHLSFMHAISEEVIRRHDGVGLVLGAMRRFQDSESLQTTALFALSSVVMKSNLYREMTMGKQGIELIIDAMRRKFKPVVQKEDSAVSGLELGTDEPILVTRVQSKSNSKTLLLQLFACAALLNLSDSEKCKQLIIAVGGLHYIFQASIKVADNSELWFIVYYIFIKFTRSEKQSNLFSEEKAVYLKPKGVPTLGEFAKRAVIDLAMARFEDSTDTSSIQKVAKFPHALSSLFGKFFPKFSSAKSDPSSSSQTGDSDLHLELSKLPIPEHLQSQLAIFKVCRNCKSSVFESGVRLYELGSERSTKLTYICSEECAKTDKDFEKRCFYLTDIGIPMTDD